jgi:HPt (histidine-containing phosphotransfer) domain-containing protein
MEAVGSMDAVLEIEQLRDVTLNDPELMKEILAALVDDTARQIELLHTAVQEGNPQRCAQLAHYSKGACANVGANRAAGMFQHIEKSAKQGEFQECTRSLAGLVRELDLLRSAAQAM